MLAQLLQPLYADLIAVTVIHDDGAAVDPSVLGDAIMLHTKVLTNPDAVGHYSIIWRTSEVADWKPPPMQTHSASKYPKEYTMERAVAKKARQATARLKAAQAELQLMQDTHQMLLDTNAAAEAASSVMHLLHSKAATVMALEADVLRKNKEVRARGGSGPFPICDSSSSDEGSESDVSSDSSDHMVSKRTTSAATDVNKRARSDSNISDSNRHSSDSNSSDSNGPCHLPCIVHPEDIADGEQVRPAQGIVCPVMGCEMRHYQQSGYLLGDMTDEYVYVLQHIVDRLAMSSTDPFDLNAECTCERLPAPAPPTHKWDKQLSIACAPFNHQTDCAVTHSAVSKLRNVHADNTLISKPTQGGKTTEVAHMAYHLAYKHGVNHIYTARNGGGDVDCRGLDDTVTSLNTTVKNILRSLRVPRQMLVDMIERTWTDHLFMLKTVTPVSSLTFACNAYYPSYWCLLHESVCVLSF